MEIKNILKLLEETFNGMVELFEKEDWKFYKFGQGGPYKRTLTSLQKMSNEHDPILFDHFGAGEETASFNKIIVLCLSTAKNTKEQYGNIDTFKRQIVRMKKIL